MCRHGWDFSDGGYIKREFVLGITVNMFFNYDSDEAVILDDEDGLIIYFLFMY